MLIICSTVDVAGITFMYFVCMRKKYKGFTLAADESFLNQGQLVIGVFSASFECMFSASLNTTKKEAMRIMKEVVNTQLLSK